MAIEIERKFLVVSGAWRAAAHERSRIAQGYLNDARSVANGDANCSVRIRLTGDAAFLNIKSRELGSSRQEFEYPVPVADAESLLLLCVGGRIDKTRHFVRHDGHLWEVDEFHGDNAGLVVAEIELEREDEAFARPDWVGKDVTELVRYYNLALADRPYSQWRDEEKG